MFLTFFSPSIQYVCPWKQNVLNTTHQGNERVRLKQNEYFIRINISLVTFPFQRTIFWVRGLFSQHRLIIKISNSEADKQKKSPKHKGSRTFQKQNKNNFFLSPGCAQSFSLYFLILSFLIVSLCICLCQCGILCEKMHHPHRFY